MIPNRILTKLIKVAENSYSVDKSNHAACISYKKRILVTGTNQAKTHPKVLPFTKYEKNYLHAEMDAILKFARQYDTSILPKCNLYVIRISNTDSSRLLLSKPCIACYKMIDFFNIKNVYWS